MTFYVLTFFFLAVLAVLESDGTPPHRPTVTWTALCVSLAVAVGLRHEVGPDWASYLAIHTASANLSLTQALSSSEPGYIIINWLSARFGFGIYGVNLVSACIFMTGLSAFCLETRRPYLALMAAFPIVIVMSAMGYTRQSIALGGMLYGLVKLGQQRFFSFAFIILVASTFHRSAVVTLPLAALATGRGRLTNIIAISAGAVLIYNSWLADRADIYVERYVNSSFYISEGAIIRIGVNALPAACFFFIRPFLCLDRTRDRIWFWMSAASLAALIALPLSPSTTMLDRVALYLTPVQLFIFASMPWAISSRRTVQTLVTFAVVAGYASVLFVWLSVGQNAISWLPYRSVIFQ